MNEERQNRPPIGPVSGPSKADGEKLLLVQRQFKDQVLRTGESSETILHSMHGIAAATNEAIERSAKGIAEVREMESALKKLGLRGGGIHQRLEEFQQSIRQSLQALQGVGGSVRELLSDNARILDQAKTLSSMTSEIDQKVDGVVASAEQITLLALNAVIAANRAGKFGQAFSVVANEVQTLAERSAVSAGEIRSLASSIQGEVKGVFESIEKVREEFNQETSQCESLIQSLGEMGKSAEGIQSSFSKVQGSLQETEPLVQGMKRTGERVGSSSEEFSRRIRKALAACETQRECYSTIDISLEALKESAKVLVTSQKPEESLEVLGQISFAVNGITDMVSGMDQAVRDSLSGIHEIAEVSTREVEQVIQYSKDKDKLRKPLSILRKSAEEFRSRVGEQKAHFEHGVLESVEHFVQGAGDCSDGIRAALDRVRGLRSHARQIQKIAWEISLIIQETNVMAFNGSVEAVRAGQFGRNFSQVANDVRELARESIQAADRIQDVVQEIQDQLGVMIQTLGDAGGKSRRFVENAQGVLRNLHLVRHHFQGFEEDVQSLETGGKSLEEMLQGSIQALDSMVVSLDNVAKSSLTSRAEAREKASEMERLQERLGELKQMEMALQSQAGGSA